MLKHIKSLHLKIKLDKFDLANRRALHPVITINR